MRTFFCLQETKLQAGQVTLNLPGYHQFWNYAEKKGLLWHGDFCQKEPLSLRLGLGVPELDTEGRLITLSMKISSWSPATPPNAQPELARIDHRLRWEDAFRDYLMGLDEKKPVLVCGDLNVAFSEIDLKNPAANRGNAGFSDQERGAFGRCLLPALRIPSGICTRT